MTLITMPKNPLELNEIIAAILIRQIDSKHIYSFRTGKIRFESLEEIPWTLDGEFGGEHDVVNIMNRKQGLQIMVKESVKEDLSGALAGEVDLADETEYEKTEEC